MKLSEIFKTAIEMGIKNDPRGEDAVRAELQKERRRYEKLSEKEKEFFDLDKLDNPYPDSRIVFGDTELKVKKVVAGIDIETSELLLVDRLNEKGAKIDLLIAHHPIGKGKGSLGDVMSLQCGYMSSVGVLPNVAEGIMAERIKSVSRSVAVNNIFRTVDAARLLNLPLICIHTPADNMVNAYVTDFLAQKNLQTVGEVVEALKEIPEYNLSAKNGVAPKILSGMPDSSIGKIYVDFTGGTEGAEENFTRLSQAGISTVVVMHTSDKHLEVAKKNYMNVVLAGHISSDSIGLNLLLDKLAANGVETVPFSGLMRVERNS